MKLLTGDLIRLVETPKERAADALAHLGGVEGVAASLGVSLDIGLDNDNTADLAQREATYGKNYIEPEKPSTIFELMWQAFQDLTIIILSVAGVFSLILGIVAPHDSGPKNPVNGTKVESDEPNMAWIEGVSILFAVFIVVLVTALNDYQKEKQFRALNAVKEDEKIKVIRNGVPAEVSKFNLVVGDVVRVDVGDILPADGLVFDENELNIDESAMTGESILLRKNRKNAPFLLSGTKVMEGVGKMLVVCVGESSQAGIISKLIMGKGHKPAYTPDAIEDNYVSVATPNNQAPELDLETSRRSTSKDDREDEEAVSPLQGKLDRLTVLIGKLGLAAAIIVFVGLVMRFSIVTFTGDKAKEWSSDFLSDYLGFFIIGITVLVVAIPEGLPLAVTIALAFSVKKMLLDHNLVRHLDACETMGSATTICSDKTGTLTTNRMTVVESYVGNTEFSSSADLRAALSPDAMAALCDGICLNSTAEILPPLKEGGKPEHTGNKTECALLQFATDMGVVYSDVRKAGDIGHMLTFSSTKKRMTVVVRISATTCRVFTKGASEIVLDLCTSQLQLDGSVTPLDEAQKNHIHTNVIETYANQAYRTLCLAYRDINASMEDIKSLADEDLERDLTCVAIVGIEDPVRDEVPGAIRQCNKAGIVVRMVTGDNMATAKSIALKCGILSPNDGSLVMEGAEFRHRVLDAHGNIIQSEFDKIWPMLRVLARSSPKDKYTLVSGLIASNLYPHGPQVVAVTGDGTNDAPALKKADVGFAMGICGTAVAKDASDIILMDDNFKSIVNAVKWGRNVYDSIAKFLQFQLTVNLVAITIAIIGAIVLEESPLSAIQLLWVNLIMDTFASLALATDSPTDALLERKPYPRTKALISRKMFKHIVGQGIFQLIVMLVLTFVPSLINVKPGYKDERVDSNPTEHYTIIFNTFVFLQLFNEINARRIHDELNVFDGFFQNKLYIGIQIFQITLQALMVQFGGLALKCAPLSASQWAICIGIGALSLPVGLLLRCVHADHFPQFFTSCNEVEAVHEPSARGKELWMRTFARLRTQIRVMKAFKSSGAQRRLLMEKAI
ncbi:calcium-translocating P-type ATPase [Saprolegnia parasitica CBS 223.65]|uniref:Calcium-transporting ATPase n=1 Tax=Saprolegnia parasitica (strain CBS 223.65) TaxID=695850 RepID=A0A067CWP6_SAPPC|nr:calcium-translocating P-type ATPase [Saprolegnia parasitica CBS 223.65]KDO31182.1 calcium-translocating P-type ATPase [Saprolegnia parasitica CBS 223.65]|eukprot:XP_012197789.1 calcium-translocating P-type ATPase [Saprolegnia parasitica CBS 223.65]